MGTRIAIYPDFSVKQDHPHAYGDKDYPYIVTCHDQGSSPRVWGQDFFTPILYKYSRIIPTRMGTRRIKTAKSSLRTDHPHAYGDKCSLQLLQVADLGSSPRVWGQVFLYQFDKYLDRIIPTRMGTSKR